MNFTVFLAVLCAAALHATWNALVKGGADKHVAMTAVVLGHVPLALIALPFTEPPSLESWPYFIGGMLFHTGYQIFLLLSYRMGDLSHVYPIARGSAPIIVTVVSTMILGVVLLPLQLLSVIVIATGIISMSLVRQADGLRNPRAALAALITGCFIAGYSLTDGLGARLSPSAVGYYAWLTLANAAIFALYMRFIKPGTVTGVFGPGLKTFVIGGSASFIAYALVVWAFTLAPIALVTALRETSIIFAMLIGVFVMKEKLNLAKTASVAVTLLGAVLLRIARP